MTAIRTGVVRTRLGRLIALAAALTLAAQVGAVSVGAPPAQAVEPEPPSPNCEWWGQASHVREEVISVPLSGSTQTDRTTAEWASAPVNGVDCGATVTGEFTSIYVATNPVSCTINGVNYSDVDSAHRDIEVSGSQSGTSRTVINLDGPEGQARVDLYWESPGFYDPEGMHWWSPGSACTGASSSYSEVTYNPSMVFGPCVPDPAQSGQAEPFYFPATAQAIQGSCTSNFTQTGDNGYSVTMTETKTFRLKRTVCDRTVDTDGGGVPDCDEFDAKTDPLDSSDDGGSKDSDGDGVPDSTDGCVNDPGPAATGGCPDSDGDGVADPGDNCRTTPNADQADLDGDGVGDVCDPDMDGDGVANEDEGPRGTSPTDPDSDDDTVGDGEDRCPTVFGSASARGCPVGELILDAGYAFTGLGGGSLAGGLTADLAGSAAGRVDTVCFRLAWQASASGVSTASLLWNGVPAAFLDETTDALDYVVDVQNSDPRKNGRFTQTVSMGYCAKPLATAAGWRATYPWTLIVAGPGGTVHSVGIDSVSVSARDSDGALLATASLDGSSSKGSKLSVSWNEQARVTAQL